MSVFGFVDRTMMPLLRKMFRVSAVGKENIPDGAFIIAANHTAMPDVVAISACMNHRRVRYMAKKEALSVPLIGPFLKALGAFPVNRGGADFKSLKYTMELLGNGEVVGIFPQGTRHPGEDPRKTEVKGGIGLIAYRSGADVLPVFLDSKNNKTTAFKKTRVIFGKVIKNEELGFEKGGGREYDAAARLIFDRICDLKYGGEAEE